jgi:ubiquinone/menaquinone biosynthesis C-methylase UbiE
MWPPYPSFKKPPTVAFHPWSEMTGIEGFKERLSGVFTRASSSYDHTGPQFFSYFGRRLVEFAEITGGSHVLDVACGRGAVLFPACRAVGATGRVFALDFSTGMVKETGSEVSRDGLANATVLKMDAERIGFPDSTFDFVLCGLSLFFFPNLDQALAGFLRVLQSGGQFAASTLEKVEDERSKRFQELAESYKDYLRPVPSAEIKNLDSEEEMRQVLSQAGFMEIEVVSGEETLYYRDEEEWWETAWSHGYRAFLERMDADILARYRKQALELILEEKTDQGIPVTWHPLYSKGKKP